MALPKHGPKPTWDGARRYRRVVSFVVPAAQAASVEFFLRSAGVKAALRKSIDASRTEEARQTRRARIAERIWAARATAAAPAALVEHTRVTAVRAIEEQGAFVPAGATGTVIHVIKGGLGYDVEFTSPEHVVISASRDELAPA